MLNWRGWHHRMSKTQIDQNTSRSLNSYLWTEFYRPQKVKDVLLPKKYKTYFESIVQSRDLPNLLLYSSSPGVGKTTIAKALLRDLDIDFMYINTSSESGIDVLRSKIAKHASVKSLNGGIKAIILDEFDGATITLQQGLRAAIEEYHKSCRFIFTANYITKIINPLKSRCQVIDFNMTEKEIVDEMVPKIKSRLKKVLQAEAISFVDNTVDKLVDTYYPDVRKMLQVLQQYSKMNGGSIDDNIFNLDTIDEEFYEFISNHKLTSARKYLIERNFNYDEIFRALFDNLVPRLEKPHQAEAIKIISEHMYKNAFVIDKEINCSAMLLYLMEMIPKK